MTTTRQHDYRLQYGASGGPSGTGTPPEVIRATSSTAAVAARSARELPIQVTDMTLLREWSMRVTVDAVRGSIR